MAGTVFFYIKKNELEDDSASIFSTDGASEVDSMSREDEVPLQEVLLQKWAD